MKGLSKGDFFMWSREQFVRNLPHDPKVADAMLAQPVTEQQQFTAMKNRLATAKLGWQPRLYNPHLDKWLHRISVPTLLLWGDDDKIIPPGYGPAFRDLIPGSRLEVFANCGHVPHIETTDEWVEQGRRLHGRSGVMKFFCFHLMPYAALDPDYDKQYNSAWVTLPNSYYDPKIGHALYNRYLDELEFADSLRLRRRVRQRASPERLWLDADPGRDGRRAVAPHEERQDRRARPRAAAAEQSAGGGGRVRDARQHHRRPAGRGFRARHRRRISFLGRQPGRVA